MLNKATFIEEDRAYKHGRILLIVFGCLFVPSYTIFSGSSLRFIFYLFPFFSLGYWFISSPSNRLAFSTRYVAALMLYSLIVLIGTLLSFDTIDAKTWIDGLKPILYILAFIPAMRFNNNSVKILTVIFLFASIFLWLAGGGTTRGELNFEESQGPLESGMAFPLGGVFIYFLLKKQKLWAFIAFILFFLAFKRVAFAAAFIIFCLIIFNRIISNVFQISKYKLALATMFGILAFGVFINVFYYEFFTYLLGFTSGTMTVMDITMGRAHEFDILSSQYGQQDLINLLFGNGPGDATRKLVEITINYPTQVHNSFLMYFYDFGVVGFAMLLTSFYVIFSRNTFGIYLFAYNLILMVTDNTFIHHYHQITYFILIAVTEYELRQPKYGGKDGIAV